MLRFRSSPRMGTLVAVSVSLACVHVGLFLGVGVPVGVSLWEAAHATTTFFLTHTLVYDVQLVR